MRRMPFPGVVMLSLLLGIHLSAEAQTKRLPPPSDGWQGPGSPAERQADHLRTGAMQFAISKGYRPREAVQPHVTDFEARGPSQVIPFRASMGEELQLKRRCTESQARSVPRCIRVDVVEIFTQIDSSQAVTLGVVPHTFVGSDAASFLEVGATSDVTNDAEIIARRYGGKAVTAIPWPIPQPTPPSP